MDIKDFKIARREMEEEIRDAVVEAIRTFQEKTGMSPQGIDIRLIDVTASGDMDRSYMVSDVKAYIPI